MTYRPITDCWLLCRSKFKPTEDGSKQSYYGAFPSGFLHRARQLLGVRRTDPVLHVCGGLVKQYLYRGFEENDRTLDLCGETNPDYLMDCRKLGAKKGDLFPILATNDILDLTKDLPSKYAGLWPAIMIDRPYTTADHAEYAVPTEAFPSNLNDLLKRALQCVEPGGRVGVLDYLWPSPPTKLGKEVAVIAVGTGRNNRARWYTVFERLVTGEAAIEPETEGDMVGSAPQSPNATETPSPSVSPSPKRRRRKKKAAANPVLFACERCEQTGLKAGQTIVSEHDQKRRCGDCHRLVAGGMLQCVACSGTRKNSKGGDCICLKTMTPADKAAVLAAVKANVCHGCKEGLLLDAPGMEPIEPLTDVPNKWHQACWTQKLQRDNADAEQKRREREREEAREKGWPICGGCARPVTPTQKNNNGRHTACGAARRRRGAAASSNIGKGF